MRIRALVRCWLDGHAPKDADMHRKCSCPKHGQFYCHRCRRWLPFSAEINGAYTGRGDG